MKKNAVNPYLPLYEYLPDAEPRLFNGRLYVYGSHDIAGGNFFCLGDYVLWSAPENDLSDWRCDGVIYRSSQDPSNREGKLELFAPDVVQGPDGRYYLYYCLRMRREFGVAVSDSPEGPFSFYGHVRRPDGSLFDDHMPYDPSVLVDDDNRVYLYYGFSSELLARKFNTEISPGAIVVELASDMLTTCSEAKVCIPRDVLAKGTPFEGHAYFEAPSMRKYDGRYYLVYSSQWCHELCYAVSRWPDRDFQYGGVIVDNADIGYQGRKDPVCMPGNNHGGLVIVGGQAYIFYHRHTHCHSYSRQGCAEPVTIEADGRIAQVEITSSGLNIAPLPARGSWPAAIACHLTCPDPERMLDFRNLNVHNMPCVMEEKTGEGEREREQFIHNFYDGVFAGYKYFRSDAGCRQVILTVRGRAEGELTLHLDDPSSPALSATYMDLDNDTWQKVALAAEFSGVHSLYLGFHGCGSFDFSCFEYI